MTILHQLEFQLNIHFFRKKRPFNNFEASIIPFFFCLVGFGLALFFKEFFV